MDSKQLYQKEEEKIIGLVPTSQPTETTMRFRDTCSETLVTDTSSNT